MYERTPTMKTAETNRPMTRREQAYAWAVGLSLWALFIAGHVWAHGG